MKKEIKTKKENEVIYLKKLQEKLRYYKQTIVASSEAIIILDFNGIVKTWNKGAEMIYGFKEKEMIGKNITKIIGKSERSLAQKNIRLIRQGKPVFVSKQTRITKDKRKVYVNITYSPIFESGEIVEVATSAEDVTKLKKALKNLEINSLAYSKFFESMSEAAVIYDIQNNNDVIIKNINRASEKLESVKRKDVIGKKVEKVFKGVKDFGLYDVIKKVYKYGKTIHHPISFYKDRYHTGWRDNIVFKLPEDGVAAVYSDVTKEIEAKETLKKSEEKFYKLFDSAFDAIFLADPKTRKLMDCNKAAERLIGYPKTKILSMKVNELHPKDLLKGTMAGFIRQANGSHEQVVTEVLNKSGKRIPVSINASIINISNVDYILGIFRNITKQKTIEDKIKSLSYIVENTLEGHALFDIGKTNRLVYVNKAWEKITGYKSSDVVNKKQPLIFDALTENSKQKKRFFSSIKSNKIFQEEMLWTTKSGKKIVVDVLSMPVKNNDGSIQWFNTIRDVTEKKKNENKNTWLASFPKFDPRPIIELNKKNEITFFNPAAGKIFPNLLKKHKHCVFTAGLKKLFLDPRLNKNILVEREVTANNRYYMQTIHVINDNILRIYSTDITDRKKVEEKLKDSETKFRSIFESANDAVWLLKGNVFVDCNMQAVRLFDCKLKSEVIGNTPVAFSPIKQPDGQYSKTKAYLYIKSAISGNNQRFYWKHKTKRGRLIDTEISLNKIIVGGKIYTQAIGRDVTKEMEKRELIKKSDELVRNVNGILLRWTPNGNISFINDYGSKMFGYDRSELIGKKVNILVPRKESTGRKLDLLIKDITKHPEKYIVNENENIKKDGSRFWVGWANKAMKDKDGNLIEILAVGNDITERINTQKKLKESEEKLSLIFNNSRFGMSIVSPDGSWLKVNNGLSEIIGYSENELMSKKFLQLIYVDDIENVNLFFNRLISGEIDSGYLEKRYVHKDGHIVWVYLSVSLVRDLKGKPLYFIVITENITERKRLDEAKDTFLSLASHQLRTPLAAIKWVLESLVGEKESFTFRQQAKLNDLMISNERIIRLVNYLLNVTRIESGKLMVNKKLTNLRELINGVAVSLKSLSKEKEIKIIIPEKLKDIYCDPLLISEALGNLLNNAINYSSENSKEIVIEVEDRDLYYLVSIHNDGFMDEQTLFKVNKFERFVRGENAMKVQPSGSGLGLYVTNKIIQLSGGNLWLESNAKIGTTFYFTIVKKHSVSRS